MRRVLNTPWLSQWWGLVICVAIRSIAEGTNRWERTTGPFPPFVWKRQVDGVLLRDTMPLRR